MASGFSRKISAGASARDWQCLHFKLDRASRLLGTLGLKSPITAALNDPGVSRSCQLLEVDTIDELGHML